MSEHISYILNSLKLSKDSLLNSTENSQILKELTACHLRCYNPLKIVIVGAVKAGKSTLLNALVEEKVSPEGVTETTASIIRIKYGTEKVGTIIYTDATQEHFSIESIYKLLEDKKNDVDFYKNCKEVVIELPLKKLTKLEIVDTPGIATTTKDNELITEEYIKQADVILWVLNGNYLGQTSVSSRIEKLCEDNKKPIIVVINHVDNMENDAERLKEYVESEDIFDDFDEVFPISSKRAYNAVQNDNEYEKLTSGYNNLLNYLEKKFDSKPEDIQISIILDDVKNILQNKLLKRHNEVLDETCKKYDLFEDYCIKLNAATESILENSKIKFKKWTNNLYKEEEDELLTAIKSKGILDNSSKLNSKIKMRFELLASNSKIQEAIRTFLIDFDKEYEKLWQIQLKRIDEDLLEKRCQLQMSIENNKSGLNPIALNNVEQLNDFSSSVTTSVAVSSLFGVGVSAYGAGLGTYAAHLSMMGALGSVMPPVLVAGALAGVAWGVWRHNSEKQKIVDQVIKNFKNIRTNVHEIVYPLFLQKAQEMSKKRVSFLTNKIEQDMLPYSKDETSKYISKIKDYSQKVQTLINEAPKYEETTKMIGVQLQKATEEIKLLRAQLGEGQDDYIVNILNTQTTIENTALENQQIQDCFRNAVLKATKELDIFSPWMNCVVVDTQLRNSFEKLLSKGVKIKILYGIGDLRDDRNWKTHQIALELQTKFKPYGDLFKIKRTNSHGKLFICDDEFYVVTSCNILSYAYDKNLGFRTEIGQCTKDLDNLLKFRKKYFDF